MKGTIININRTRTRAAVSTENGISLIEVRGGAVLRIGDETEGELERLGTQRVTSTRGPVEIFVDDIQRTTEEGAKWVWTK